MWVFDLGSRGGGEESQQPIAEGIIGVQGSRVEGVGGILFGPE